MVPEAPLGQTEAGLAPAGDGWFVLNAREARWRHREGRGNSLPFTGWTDFEAETYFPQLGVQLVVLAPGEPIGMYHWEADQEDFLVLSGEALLIVEGEERALRRARRRRPGAHRRELQRRRVHRGRGRALARRGGRGGDGRRRGRLRPLSGDGADEIPRRLASGFLGHGPAG